MGKNRNLTPCFVIKIRVEHNRKLNRRICIAVIGLPINLVLQTMIVHVSWPLKKSWSLQMDDNHGLSKFHEHGQITEIQPDYTITQRPHISAGIWDG